MRLLFVCTGNTCRSPMCELYFKHLCQQANCAELEASSAGLSACDGDNISMNAIVTLDSHGVAIKDFHSRRLRSHMLDKVDLIIPMTRTHRDRILEINRENADKLRLLMEFADQPECDVPDPFGGDAEIYAACFAQMKTALDNLFLELLKNK